MTDYPSFFELFHLFVSSLFLGSLDDSVYARIPGLYHTTVELRSQLCPTTLCYYCHPAVIDSKLRTVFCVHAQ